MVRVLPGFDRDIQRGRTTAVQILIDGTNSNTASIVSGLRVVDGSRVFAGRVMRSSKVANRLMARTARAPVHAGVPR